MHTFRLTVPILKFLILVLGLLISSSVFAGTKQSAIRSIDKKTHEFKLPSKQPDGATIELKAFWFEAARPAEATTAQLPAVALFHGCGGPYNNKGELSERMREYALLLNTEGYHALIVDSLTARGEKELCTQKIGKRRVTQAHRMRDALAALQWLAQRPEVDAARMALLGWSHGASAVLAATNLQLEAVKLSAHKPRAAVAFYPGCEAELRRGYQPSANLLMMVGELDDWTSPEPCKKLQAQPRSDSQQLGELNVTIDIEVMPDAYHGFDSTQPVRVRREVPNGVKPGQGVHVGGNPAARKRAHERLRAYLKEILL